MGVYLRESDREEVRKLAERTKTIMPGTINVLLWPVPILEKIIERLEKLEEQCKK